MVTINNGYQGWKILRGYYLDDNTLTGMIMPNIEQISPQAIVPSSATITFNEAADVTPTGGVDEDIWYNKPSNMLYKNISGTWTLLTDRVSNNFYLSPIYNTTACPIPPSGA